MNTKVTKVGIVGCGALSQRVHIPNFVNLESCQVVALCDLREDVAKKVARKYRIRRVYGKVEDLLGDEEIEAVVLLLPQHVHPAYTIQSCQAGKHVFMEKPLAVSSQIGLRIVQAAEKNKTKAMVGYMKRYDPGVVKAKSILDQYIKSGELGAITYARFHNFNGDWLCGAPTVVGQTGEVKPPDEEGASYVPDFLSGEEKRQYYAWLNVFCHDINLMRYLLGEPRKAKYVAKQASDNPWRTRLISLFDYEDFDAVVETGGIDAHYFDEETKIYFDKGWIKLQLSAPLLINVPSKLTVYTLKDGFQEPALGWKWGFREEARCFLNWIQTGIPCCQSTAKDSYKDLVLTESLWKSLEKE